MSCTDKNKFKTSEAATKASLRTKGAIDAFLNIIDINLFRKLNKAWSENAKKRFNIKGNLFYEDNDRAVPNTQAFKQIDNAKGIFYNLDDTNQEVHNIFENNPELTTVGTVEQYSEYIKSIFLKSAVKDIVYHGTGEKSKINKFNGRTYFSNAETAGRYASWDYSSRLEVESLKENGTDENIHPQVIAAVINLNNPKYLDNQDFKATEKNYEGHDGIISKETLDPLGGKELQIVVNSSNQIHILGSQEDVNGFKNFVNKKVFKENEVNFGLKAIEILSTEKAKQIFEKGNKNNWSLDKILTELQIPKEQKQLILDLGITNREQIALELASNYSYSVEINTAIEQNKIYDRTFDGTYIYEEGYNQEDADIYLEEGWEEVKSSDKDVRLFRKSKKSNYYSNLTVPGGTNYTENEIATSAITPFIKGHAQFSTDNGIGWFRSDDRIKNSKIEEYEEEVNGELITRFNSVGNPSKSRRILEVQSDLFQKGRNKQNLVFEQGDYKKLIGFTYTNSKGNVIKITNVGKTSDTFKPYIDFTIDGKQSKGILLEKALKQPLIEEVLNAAFDDKGNNFLQLLNKDNNWVTFFVKSIIQDSAKKGYEKVLFPKGDTASKIEGHTTLEEFKKQKEDRIEELERAELPAEYMVGETSYIRYRDTNTFEKLNYRGQTEITKEEFIKNMPDNINYQIEINQLKQELERVEKEGFGALKPIYTFYENTVSNILKKQGYSLQVIKDEFGNEWNEITIDSKAKETIYFNEQSQSNSSEVSKETIERVKQVLKKMGVDVQTLSTYAKNNPDISLSGVNGLADLAKGIIAIAEGKENVVLTEEMVHIATAIIEQTNPALISELISKITKYPIYKETLERYKNNKQYQLPNGKPDIRKIKKEAADKMIASIIMQNNEQADLSETDKNIFRLLWNKILNFIQTLYNKSDVKLFENIAYDIMEGNIKEDVSSISLSSDVLFNLSQEDVSFQEKILETEKYLRKQEATEENRDNSIPPEEQDSNWYERLVDGEWVKVTHRVTDRVKDFYAKAFGNKTFTAKEEAFNEFKRDNGVKYHGFFEDIWDRYFNADGTRRNGVKKIGVGLNYEDKQIYSKLEKYFNDLVKEHTIDKVAPLVFSEIKILDPEYGKTGEAGTIDLLIRDAKGVTHIYDWKFMTIGEQAKDIAWYKQAAYDKQLGRYKDILRNNYGVSSFGKMRAVPIHLKIDTSTNLSTGKTFYKMREIAIGNVSSDIEDDLTLTPVSESTESTGNKELDSLIKNLNSLHTQLSSNVAKNETEKELKAKKLNDIKAAIRNAQTSSNIIPLLSVIKDIKVDGNLIIEEYNSEFANITTNDPSITEEKLSNFAESIREYLAVSQVFGNIQDTLGDLIYNPSMDKDATSELEKKLLAERKQLFIELQQDTLEIRRIKLALEGSHNSPGISQQFADKFIGQRHLVNGLLNPEAIVKGIGSWFDKTSDISLASVQILYKMVVNAKDRALRKAVKESEILMDIRQKLIDRGVDLKEISKKLYQQKEGKHVNHLVYKFKKEFYDGVKENAAPEKRSKQWLRDNIDIPEYKKAVSKIVNEKVSYIKKKYSNDEELKQKLITEELQKWDYTREDFTGWDNYILKRFPKKEKWYSDEYLEIQKDPELLRLYEFISNTNEKATELGYISNEVRNTFLPFVRKSTAEALSFDNSISPITNFFDTLKLNVDDVGFGKINEITKEVEYGLPKYYTHDFTTTKGNKAEVSEDIFKNLLLYVNHLNKYEQMSQIEEQLKLVKTVETFKNHLATNRLGNLILDKGVAQELAGNEENAKLYDTFLRGVFYEQKYALDDSDVEINTSAVNFVKKKINKIFDKEIFDINEEDSSLSLVKSMDTLNTLFQLKTLGFDLATGAVNAFGANVQLSAQSGNYFKYSEVAKKQLVLIGNKFKNDNEREMFIQLLDMFMPLKEDPMYEKIKQAGLTKLTRTNFSEWLMVAMRIPEQHIEKSVFLTMLDNTMVVDGKLVNIREYAKKQFSNRYSSAESAKTSKQDIEALVKDLKETKSISATKQLVDGKLVIPGFDNNSNEVLRLSNLVKRISRNATGNMSEEDRNRVSMNIWLRSFMVFKNWIPPLLKTRFGQFKKISDDFSIEIDENGLTTGEKYDVGRVRLWFHVMGTSLKDKTSNVYNILTLNEKGLEAMDSLYKDYAAKYEQTTGQKLNMSKEDFYDMVRTNLRNQMKEILIMLLLTGLTFSTKLVDIDDDEDKAAKNRFRYFQRTLDKFVSEISFFYNPAEFDRMLSSGGILPAVGLFTDLLKFIEHLTMELTGFDISDPSKTMDEIREKAHPLKYGAKMLPITKTLVTYMGILDPEFAKEHDITIQNQTKK